LLAIERRHSGIRMWPTITNNEPRKTDNGRQTEGDRPILTAENLTKIFRSGEERVVVFENLNFEVRKGELVALIGESGAGKTTLLHVLAALDTPTSGEVYFSGEKVSGFRDEERAAYRNARIGFVWQMHFLLPEFTALENIMLPQLIGSGDFQSARARAKELLNEVGLEISAGRRVGELSGGEQQRVALARALANQPAVLLADEPTGSLDYRTAGRLMDLLERMHRVHQLTSVLATHNRELAQRADRTWRLENGKLTETVVPRFH
jgi:lipoprotein-releasing system ATP-binding protein